MRADGISDVPVDGKEVATDNDPLECPFSLCAKSLVLAMLVVLFVTAHGQRILVLSLPTALDLGELVWLNFLELSLLHICQQM
mmetsp:Transcript_84922/g.163607  ORF Transcript_84922/g.163607 Transcript_84922/m.163607 type:complete len:83 (-) Transcript_84922:19-267(-)